MFGSIDALCNAETTICSTFLLREKITDPLVNPARPKDWCDQHCNPRIKQRCPSMSGKAENLIGLMTSTRFT